MPTIHEIFNSRVGTEGPDSNRTLRYAVLGTEDDLAVDALVVATAPSVYNGLALDSFDKDTPGGGVWFVEVEYRKVERLARPEAGDDLFNFDTTGGTRHITQSLETVDVKYVGADQPDFKGAINVTSDAVEGVDIDDRMFSFNIERYIADSVLTNAYLAALYNQTGTTNNAPWKINIRGKTFNFKKREALFKGATGGLRGEEDWRIDLKFAAIPNITGRTIGTMTGIDKKGWEYLWVRYQDIEGANQLVKQPKSVHVERVYPESNFVNLIGTLGDP